MYQTWKYNTGVGTSWLAVACAENDTVTDKRHENKLWAPALTATSPPLPALQRITFTVHPLQGPPLYVAGKPSLKMWVRILIQIQFVSV